MAQEESILGCSNSGSGGGGGDGGGSRGGGGRSKKIKQKKVPQRGLGVAQLEKIRLEEQQKKESLQAANILARNAVDSSPYLEKFRTNFAPFYNSAPNLQENCVQGSKQSKVEIDSKAILSSKLWAGDCSLARLDHHGFIFDPNLHSSFENSHVLPLSVVSQRSNQFHLPCSSSSSMLNVSSSYGIQPLMSSQMEPPSNQSSRSNNYSPLWTEEDKIVGMKRSYPFSLESPPSPSFSFRPVYAASSSKSDDLALRSNGYTDRMDLNNKCTRVSSSNSSPLPGKKQNEATRDDGRLNGDFLTLAPPSVASPPSITKNKYFSEFRASQEYSRSQMYHRGSIEQSFSFFPMKLLSNQTSTDASGNGEKEESIDLNLKL